MIRSATISTVAFLVFANPSLAGEQPLQKARRVSALIGEPSADPSAHGLVVELQTRSNSEPFVIQPATQALKPNLFVAGPYGAWDLDAPNRRSATRFSISGAFPDGTTARFDATPVKVGVRRAA